MNSGADVGEMLKDDKCEILLEEKSRNTYPTYYREFIKSIVRYLVSTPLRKVCFVNLESTIWADVRAKENACVT